MDQTDIMGTKMKMNDASCESNCFELADILVLHAHNEIIVES